MPPEVDWNSSIEVAKQEGTSALHLFGIHLLACCYSLLTIGFTTDAMLFGGLSPTSLPIIQVPVPMIGFYLVVPFLLLCAYLCFHFQLRSFWDAVAGLPAAFPDGSSVHRKVYIWTLFEALRRRYAKSGGASRTPTEIIHAFMASLLIWWLVPLSLIAFRFRYLPKHDPVGTTMQDLLVVVTWVCAFRFRAFKTRQMNASPNSSEANRPRVTLRGVGAFAVVVILASGPLTTSPWKLFDSVDAEDPSDLAQIAHRQMDADLYQAELSVKPPGWTGDQLEAVKGARLRGADLRRANLIGAFLVKADLVAADLRGATLNNADIRNSSLNSANLNKTYFTSSNLSKASLIFARLDQADLSYADLRGANLQCASLVHANLSRTDFRGADLRNAKVSGQFILDADFSSAEFGSLWLNFPSTDLRGADLRFARGISIEQLKQAVTDSTTLLPRGVLADPLGGVAYTTGGDVTSPRITRKVEPRYTAEALAAKTKGEVLVRVLVSEEGKPINVNVLQSLGKGLDDNACRSCEALEI